MHQVVLFNDLAPVFNVIEQSVKSLGSEGNGLAFVEEAARVGFDAELAKLEDARLRGANAFVSGISEVFRKLQGHSKDFPCAWERDICAAPSGVERESGAKRGEKT
jgi:hypothetical protein